MRRNPRLLLRGTLIGLPVAVAVFWLASGREVLTKAARAVTVQVPDTLFGDTNIQTQFVRGPVFGYYVGLDAVIITTLLCTAVAGAWWLFGRRRARPKEAV